MKIGFTVLLADHAGGGDAPRYAAVKDMAQRAEAGGFDSIWLYDHLLYRFPGQPTLGIWECWSMLAALAEATERVELGTLVICNSFRNPALLAKMAETVDEISDGRLILGIGAGWNKPEYEAFGIPYDRIRGHFEEAVQIIKPLLRQRRLSFAGHHYGIDDCEITPRGPRDAGVPLMIGAMGPRMMNLAARHGDLWNTAYTGNADTFAEPLARFRQACLDVDRDPNTIEVSALANIVFTDLGATPPASFDAGDLELPDSATNAAALMGTDDEMAAELQKYEEMGTAHLMFHCHPYTEQALDRLSGVVARYRNS